MNLSILYLNLLVLLGTVYSICVLDTKKGWRLDCGLRDSYLLRIKDFGGFKANFDFGFGVGDEKGFPNSITKSNKPKEFNPYAHKKKKSKAKHHKKPSYGHRVRPVASYAYQPQTNAYRMPMQSYVSPVQQTYSQPQPFYITDQSATHVSDNQVYSSGESHGPHDSIPHSQSEHITISGDEHNSQNAHSNSEHIILHSSNSVDPPSHHEQSVAEEQFQPSQHEQVTSSYSELRRNDNRRFSRRNDFPYQFHEPEQMVKPKKKKKKRMWPFNLFSWGKKNEEKEEYTSSNSIDATDHRRQFVQTPQQYRYQSQFANQRQVNPQFAAQSQFVRAQSDAYQQAAAYNPYYQYYARQQYAHPYYQTQLYNQRPFVFRSPNIQPSTPKSVTVGREMAAVLKVPSNTVADSDNVPSFAAKKFVVREAPKEFYPPKYHLKNPPNKHVSVQISRTNFYCEEQSYLPGIYADTQLGCKMFHLCVPSAVGSTLTSYLCPNSTLFDQSILQCNYWYNVDCESSSSNFDANLALARSYRKINAAHLDLHAATDTKSLSLLSQNNLGGSMATNRRGRFLETDPEETRLESNINNVLKLIKSEEETEKNI